MTIPNFFDQGLRAFAQGQQIGRGLRFNPLREQAMQLQNQQAQQNIDLQNKDEARKNLLQHAVMLSSMNPEDRPQIISQTVDQFDQVMPGYGEMMGRFIALSPREQDAKLLHLIGALTGGMPGAETRTATRKDFEYWQSLPEGAEKDAFGRDAGFISDEGQELSEGMQKRLDESSKAYEQSIKDVDTFSELFKGLSSPEVQETLSAEGGWRASLSETYKDITGGQDDISQLRRKYRGIKASRAVQNLPPGAASDKDIELALAGFPPDNAPAPIIQSFLKGMVKMEAMNAEFQDFRSRFIAEHGSLRTKDGRSLLQEWNDEREEAWERAQQRSDELQITQPEPEAPSIEGYEIEVVG